MSKHHTILLSIVLAIISAAAGFAFYHWLVPPKSLAPEPAAELPVPEFRPNFTLTDIESRTRSITEWDGKALLVNFWATWCPPCRKEIPLLMELQNQYGTDGLQVIGIAIDDLRAVKDYAADMGINYPTLVGEEDAIKVANDFGIDLYGLPFSVLTDRHGRIVQIHMGEITPDEADELVAKALGTDEDVAATAVPAESAGTAVPD